MLLGLLFAVTSAPLRPSCGAADLASMAIKSPSTEKLADIQLLHALVCDLVREAGVSEAVVICGLGECAATLPVIQLLELLQTVARIGSNSWTSREQAERVLEAFSAILSALHSYRGGHEKLQGRLLSQLRKLKGARPQDWCALLHRMTQNPEQATALWSALYRAAADTGVLREWCHEHIRRIQVLVNGAWVRSTPEAPWEKALTLDVEQFFRIVDQAIKTSGASTQGFDYVRRLRSLAKEPTEQKLRNFVHDSTTADCNDMGVAKIGFGYAGRRTKIFPDELPPDWVERVAREPKQIARLAQAFLDLIASRQETRGRPTEKALDAFADVVGSQFAQLRGKPITYTRGTENSQEALRGKSHGLGLEVMLAALQLVDSSMGPSQARKQIQRLRNW